MTGHVAAAQREGEGGRQQLAALVEPAGLDDDQGQQREDHRAQLEQTAAELHALGRDRAQSPLGLDQVTVGARQVGEADLDDGGLSRLVELLRHVLRLVECLLGAGPIAGQQPHPGQPGQGHADVVGRA